MSKSGGIAYLIKHGRASSPVATRTKMRGKGYAAGGQPINNSLGYGPEYDYVFEPGGMTLNAEGKPVYTSGKFVRKAVTPAAAATGAPTGPAASSGGSGNRRNDDGDGGGVADIYHGMDSGSNPNWGATNNALNNAKIAAAAITDKFGLSPENSDRVAGLFGLDSDKQTAEKVAALGPLQNTGYSPTGGIDPATAMQARAAGEAAAEAQAADARAADNSEDTDYGNYGNTEGTGWSSSDSYSGYSSGDNSSSDNSSSDSSSSSSDGATGGLARRGRIRHMAAGGIGSLADHGGFIGSYAHGGRMLRGPGDGLSDNIPAVIGRKQPARLADGEFVVSADVVSALGGGSTEAGSRKLYSMMDRIRKAAHGSKKQVKPVKERKVLPA